MKTVRRLIYRQVFMHVGLVALAFSSLFFFIDFVDEVQHVGKQGYTMLDAIWHCVLAQGTHFYDLFPIALLIGSIMALARMAQTSEFTILRTGGLGPGRALWLLGVLGIGAAMVTVVVGNWVVPWTEKQSTLHRARFNRERGISLGHGGAWLRERRELDDRTVHNVTVNVGTASSSGLFGNIRIFEFDGQGRLLRRLSAKEARMEPQPGAEGSIWHLQNVVDTLWLSDNMLGEDAVVRGTQFVRETRHPALDWHSGLTPGVISASVLPPETMSTASLWRYTQHLALNAQAAQRYEIEFWKKSFYPLVCLVMMALSLPFAYLHARSGGMSLKIFGGIMLGISFVLINHITSHLGLLHQWQPWLAASAPSMFYLLLSMSAFVWLVRYR